MISYIRQPQTSFYAAKGTYSVLRTSNSWTASGLRLKFPRRICTKQIFKL
ncbi:MAG: DUF2459 domain-containing protein [Richelia sp.]|nr:DUF2459 domain-containing protein [Richelia sp.]